MIPSRAISPRRLGTTLALPQSLSTPRLKIGPALAAAFGAAYVARASLAASIGSEWTLNLVAQCSIAAVLGGGAYVLSSGVARPSWAAVALVLAGAASLRHCEVIEFAAVRWLGWTLILLTIGPLNNSPSARSFRRWTMATVFSAFVTATLASATWWLAGLPNLGRGDFTGIMAHSMTLAPLAAITGLASLARAASGGLPAWYGVFAVATLVTTLASSRSALAAMILGVVVIVVLKLKRRPILSAALLGLTFLGAATPDATLEMLAGVLPAKVTEGLAQKSWNHSREHHWEARWEEFLSSPLTGVGFAAGWEDTAGYNEDTGAIESGSSYISVLSMTGAVGAAAVLLLAASLTFHVWRHWSQFAPRQRLEIGSLAAFWTVHLGAEGYLYAVGSLMGLALWLWVGSVFDQIDDLSQKRSHAPATMRGIGEVNGLTPVFAAGGTRW